MRASFPLFLPVLYQPRSKIYAADGDGRFLVRREGPSTRTVLVTMCSVARSLDLSLTTHIHPVPKGPGWTGLRETRTGPRRQEHSLVDAVGGGDDPHRGDDGAPAQMVALELEAGLPGPLRERRHVSTHDA